jgi:hypothetical protein
VFDLPVNPKSRVGRAIAHLADAQRITRFVAWCAHGTLHPNLHPLAEADRCAEWILAWLKTTPTQQMGRACRRPAPGPMP